MKPTLAHPRLAEVLGALSVTTDLANGHRQETALRTALLAVGLGKAMGRSVEELKDFYFLALMQSLGCTAYAHEEAEIFGGGDNNVRHQFASIDYTNPSEVVPAVLASLPREAPVLDQARSLARLGMAKRGLLFNLSSAHCEVGVRLAQRLGLRPGVILGIGQVFERWDGRGSPRGLRGEELGLAARVLRVAQVARLHHHLGGVEMVIRVLKQRSGGQLDPAVAAAFADHARQLLAPLELESVWDEALEAEPTPHLPLGSLDEVVHTFGDYVDLKSAFSLGHSSGVSALAEAAGASLRVSETDRAHLRQAGMLHDLGRVSVATGVWEKRGSFNPAEWERVRLHPYYTERILQRSPLLRPLAATAGAHHERLDGSGYHRSSQAGGLSLPVRVLAAADVYQSMTEDQPHTEAPDASEAARRMRKEVVEGRLDGDAVQAVLEAAGHRQRRRRLRPAGLSSREVEVLGLLAQGSSNRQTAGRLGISARTVQSHVLHIYNKIGVSTRAAAALFAMEHDLLRKDSAEG